jgi:hypothetical protein
MLSLSISFYLCLSQTHTLYLLQTHLTLLDTRSLSLSPLVLLSFPSQHFPVDIFTALYIANGGERLSVGAARTHVWHRRTNREKDNRLKWLTVGWTKRYFPILFFDEDINNLYKWSSAERNRWSDATRYLSLYILYIYLYVRTHTHTHTHIYIYQHISNTHISYMMYAW